MFVRKNVFLCFNTLVLCILGMTADEENYEEAIRAVNSNLGGGKATSDIRKILDDDSCINLTRNVSLYIIIIKCKDIVRYSI